jgi:RNA polymerase sigma-70 factor (ECF subfamily)
VQAAIAAVHAEARDAGSTDWTEIVALYDRLMSFAPSPVVALNRAAAVSMRDGPEAGLALLDELAADAQLDRYHLLHAARGAMLDQVDDRAGAAEAFRRALALATNPVDRRFLERRLREVSS